MRITEKNLITGTSNTFELYNLIVQLSILKHVTGVFERTFFFNTNMNTTLCLSRCTKVLHKIQTISKAASLGATVHTNMDWGKTKQW